MYYPGGRHPCKDERGAYTDRRGGVSRGREETQERWLRPGTQGLTRALAASGRRLHVGSPPSFGRGTNPELGL